MWAGLVPIVGHLEDGEMPRVVIAVWDFTHCKSPLTSRRIPLAPLASTVSQPMPPMI